MFDHLRNLTKSAEEKQQEALNAYLDDALPPRQRQRFEEQLAQDSDLQAQVRQVRALKQQLRRLPQRPVPRSFMLDPAVHGRPAKQPLLTPYPALRTATVMTAFFFILAIAADLFLVQSRGGMLAPAAQDVAMVAEEAVEAEPAAESVIEVTRVVEEIVVEDVQVEAEVVVEVEEEAAAEEMVEEVETSTEVMEAPAEAMAAEAPEESLATKSADAAAEGEALLLETQTFAEVGEQEAATPTAAPTLAAERATILPTPTATISALPRPVTETPQTNRAMTEDIDAQEEAEIAAAPTALPVLPTTEPQPPSAAETQPLSGLLVVQIALGALFVLLALVTLLARRQR